MQFSEQIRDCIRQVRHALDAGLVHLIDDQHLLECGAGNDGLTDDTLLPGHRPALRIEAGAQPMQIQGTVPTAAHIVLTRPLQFDRNLTARRLEDLRSLDRIVGVRVRPPAKGAAGIEHIDPDLLRGEAEHSGHRRLIRGLELLAVEHADTITIRGDDAIKRLHGRMGQVRHREFSLDDPIGPGEALLDIALAASHSPRPFSKLAVLRQDLL